ncbi:hypothetical protein TRVL_07183 [Trypanosoma vivax]|nr:hypothetical protein TRVL_07183 [Trypanosoma vivax]
MFSFLCAFSFAQVSSTSLHAVRAVPASPASDVFRSCPAVLSSFSRSVLVWLCLIFLFVTVVPAAISCECSACQSVSSRAAAVCTQSSSLVTHSSASTHSAAFEPPPVFTVYVLSVSIQACVRTFVRSPSLVCCPVATPS